MPKYDHKCGVDGKGLPMRTSSDYSKGMVMKQSPTDGNQVAKNSEVAIVVSSGKVSTQKLTIDLSEYIEKNPSSPLRSRLY